MHEKILVNHSLECESIRVCSQRPKLRPPPNSEVDHPQTDGLASKLPLFSIRELFFSSCSNRDHPLLTLTVPYLIRKLEILPPPNDLDHPLWGWFWHLWVWISNTTDLREKLVFCYRFESLSATPPITLLRLFASVSHRANATSVSPLVGVSLLNHLHFLCSSLQIIRSYKEKQNQRVELVCRQMEHAIKSVMRCLFWRQRVTNCCSQNTVQTSNTV